MRSRWCWIASAVAVACSSPPTPAPLPKPVAALPHPIPAWTADPPVTLEPDVSLDDRVRAARALALSGATGDAVQRFEAILRDDPLHAPALWELGRTRFAMGDYEAAASNWFMLRSVRPDYPGLERYFPIARMRADRNRRLQVGRGVAIDTVPEGEEFFSVAAVGDMQLGMGWPPNRVDLPPDSARSLFALVRPWLSRADIAFGNLETALADSGNSTKCRAGSRNCYAFRAPTVYARTLRDAGLDVVSINNNHAGDFGAFGRRSTRSALAQQRIVWSGLAGRGVLHRNGLSIAVLSFSSGSAPFLVSDIPAAVDSVRAAAADHDLVFVSFHGGAEGATQTRVPRTIERSYGENRGDVYAFAHAVVDAGADLVLGHGPHVLRGMEVYRGRFIAYSLGNFTAWNGFNLRGALGVSAVLTVTVAPNGVATAARIDPVRLHRPGIPTPDADQTAIATVRHLSESDFGAELFDESGVWTRNPRDGSSPPAEGTARD